MALAVALSRDLLESSKTSPATNALTTTVILYVKKELHLYLQAQYILLAQFPVKQHLRQKFAS